MSIIREILVPFGGRNDELNALQVALTLGKNFAAHVHVLHVSPDPKEFMAAAYAGIGIPAPSFNDLTKEIEKHTHMTKQIAEKKYHELVNKSGIEYEEIIVPPERASASLELITGYADDLVAIRGRLADLIIMSRTIKEINTDYEAAIISGLFNTGRPVLFVPPDPIATDVLANIVIAWNGSAQAARAVYSALPLLKEASKKGKVLVLSKNTDESKEFPITPQELCFYLKRHDIEAESIITGLNGLSTAAAILNESKKLNATLIVMGAFSHSRIREMILGGITDFMLGKADIPIFMSH